MRGGRGRGGKKICIFFVVSFSSSNCLLFPDIVLSPFPQGQWVVGDLVEDEVVVSQAIMEVAVVVAAMVASREQGTGNVQTRKRWFAHTLKRQKMLF